MSDEVDRSPDTKRFAAPRWPMAPSAMHLEQAARQQQQSLRPAHPTIERYLRVTVEIPGGSIEAGLERRLGEPLTLLRAELRRIISAEALILNGDDVTDESAQRIIDSIDLQVRQVWSDRAWFLEVWDAVEALSQVYQPYGMPRHQHAPSDRGG